MRNYVFCLLCALLLPVTFYAQVAINGSNVPPNASSMLDVSSTTKGILVPRLTTTERLAILTPANGLLVYDSTAAAFFYYDTIVPQWVKIGTEINTWSVRGNTQASGNFLGTINNTSLSFRTANEERMRISSTGNIAVGTGSAGGSGYQAVGPLSNKRILTVGTGGSYVADAPAVLELVGSTNDVGEEVGMLEFVNKSSNGQNYNFARISAHKEDFNATYSSLRFYTRAGIPLKEVMRINEAGRVGINCTAPAATLHVNGTIRATTVINTSALACSDIRYKKDITHLTGALNKVLKLNGVSYYWKQNEYADWGFTNAKQVGFIAQELEEVFPEVVGTAGDGYKAIDYSKLTPMLVEAIKEQQVVIVSQKNDITRLQQDLDNLRDKMEKYFATTK